MAAHSVIKISINPQTSTVYIHDISATERTIEIVGENITVTSTRRGLIPNVLRELIDDPRVDRTVKTL